MAKLASAHNMLNVNKVLMIQILVIKSFAELIKFFELKYNKSLAELNCM